MSRKRILAAAAAIAIGAATLQVQAGAMKMRQLETAVEASTEMVSVPRSLPSNVSVQVCADCVFLTLSVDKTSRFFVGKYEVKFDLLRRYADRGSSRLDLFYDAKTKRVTRMILRAELEAADIPRGAAKTSPKPG